MISPTIPEECFPRGPRVENRGKARIRNSKYRERFSFLLRELIPSRRQTRPKKGKQVNMFTKAEVVEMLLLLALAADSREEKGVGAADFKFRKVSLKKYKTSSVISQLNRNQREIEYTTGIR